MPQIRTPTTFFCLRCLNRAKVGLSCPQCFHENELCDPHLVDFTENLGSDPQGFPPSGLFHSGAPLLTGDAPPPLPDTSTYPILPSNPAALPPAVPGAVLRGGLRVPPPDAPRPPGRAPAPRSPAVGGGDHYVRLVKPIALNIDTSHQCQIREKNTPRLRYFFPRGFSLLIESLRHSTLCMFTELCLLQEAECIAVFRDHLLPRLGPDTAFVLKDSH